MPDALIPFDSHAEAWALVDDWYTETDVRASSAARRNLVAQIYTYGQRCGAQEREACIAYLEQHGERTYPGTLSDAYYGAARALRAMTP